jgi:hypothetical protein
MGRVALVGSVFAARVQKLHNLRHQRAPAAQSGRP